MRRAARVEGAMVGAAVATSAARRPVVVAAPVAAVGVAPVVAPASTVVVETYPPAVIPPPIGYGQPTAAMMAPAPMPVAAAAVRPGVAAATVGTAAAAVAVAERQHFYLVNEAVGTVLAVDRSLLQPGAHAVIERRRPEKAFHQIWYLDHENVIRSKLTDFALECRGRDERVKLAPYVGEARQQWVLDGHRIVNRVVRTDCLGLRRMLRLKEDADVIMQVYEGKPYQHWRREPIIL